MAEVKSAQITISEFWHDHVHCKTVGKAPRWDTELGVVCACAEVLGWPDPERKETLSAYTRRVASERVDAASAPGRVKGAFGTYDQPTPEPEGVAVTGHDPGWAEGEPAHDDDPGPDEPEPEVDWGEPPADEPEPEPIEIEAPHVKAVAARVDEIVGDSYGQADEAQAAPWGAEPSSVEPPAWEGVDDAPEKPSNEGIGSEVVPYAGTPIMPTEAEVLDPLTGRLAPLDPTLPYTPADVELKIVEILRQLENSELFLRQQLARLHQATHNYKMRYNLALKQSSAPNSGKQTADAVLATERESFEMTQAEMLVRALRDSQHNLRAMLSGHQSVAKSLAVSLTNSLDGRERPPLPPEPPRWT